MAASARRLIPRLAYAGAVLTFVFGLVWITANIRAPDLDPAQVLPHGALRIAVDTSYPPFASFDRSGELVGMEIDLGNALGAELGLPVHFHPTGFDGVYDLLQSGVVDIALAQLRVNPLRMSDVLYTRPYFNAGLVLVTPESSGIETMEGIARRSLAYEFGSSADNEARLWSRRIAPFERQPYEIPAHALDAVRLEEAHAALVDAVTARLYLRDHPDWPAQIHDVTVEPFAIAVRIDHGDIWRLVDAALGEIMTRGDLDTLIDRWM